MLLLVALLCFTNTGETDTALTYITINTLPRAPDSSRQQSALRFQSVRSATGIRLGKRLLAACLWLWHADTVMDTTTTIDAPLLLL